MQNNIAILFCDNKHSPMTQLLSEYGMSNRIQRIQTQFRFSGRSKERVWKKIVVGKIINQARCVENNIDKSKSIVLKN